MKMSSLILGILCLFHPVSTEASRWGEIITCPGSDAEGAHPITWNQIPNTDQYTSENRPFEPITIESKGTPLANFLHGTLPVKNGNNWAFECLYRVTNASINNKFISLKASARGACEVKKDKKGTIVSMNCDKITSFLE